MTAKYWNLLFQCFFLLFTLPASSLPEQEPKGNVVLIHGIMDVRGAGWGRMGTLLEQDGNTVLNFYYDSYLKATSISEAAETLSGFIENSIPPCRSLSLVCHSQGGLIAEWYCLNLDESEQVKRLITLSTPFYGNLFDYRMGSQFVSHALNNEQYQRVKKNPSFSGLFYPSSFTPVFPDYVKITDIIDLENGYKISYFQSSSSEPVTIYKDDQEFILLPGQMTYILKKVE